jgi:hypothetical protein
MSLGVVVGICRRTKGALPILSLSSGSVVGVKGHYEGTFCVDS